MKEKVNIILCEGTTDKDLLGYFMFHIVGWQYKKISRPPFPNTNINWYKLNENNILGIWSVEGNDFTAALEEIAKREKLEHSVERLAIVTDHDDSSAENERFQKVFSTLTKNLCVKNLRPRNNNDWQKIDFYNSFGEASILFCYILVPGNELGALETFMLISLSEKDSLKKKIIERSKNFIANLSKDEDLKQSKILQERREKIKAELGVFISIFSPDRVFTTMNELIESVQWENFDTSYKQFQNLRSIHYH